MIDVNSNIEYYVEATEYCVTIEFKDSEVSIDALIGVARKHIGEEYKLSVFANDLGQLFVQGVKIGS